MLDAAKNLIGRIKDESIRQEWLDALPTTKAGTAKAWFEVNHGRKVDLLQATVLSDGTLRNGWAPTGRVIDSKSLKAYVMFDESRREYKGMRVEAVSDEVMVASSPFGDDTRQIMVYKIAKD